MTVGQKLDRSQLTEQYKKLKRRFDLYKYGFIALTCAQFLSGFFVFCFSVWYEVPGINNAYRLTSSESAMNAKHSMVAFMWGVSFFLIAFGALAFISLVYRNKYLLTIQFSAAILMSIILLILFAIVVSVKVKTGSEFEERLSISFVRNYYGDDADNWESVVWKYMQISLDCCGVQEYGVDDYLDYDIGERDKKGKKLIGATFFRGKNRTERRWPESCCLHPKGLEEPEETQERLFNCTTFKNPEGYRNTEGCLVKLQKFLGGQMGQTAAAVWISMMLQIGFSVIIVQINRYTIKVKQCMSQGKMVSTTSLSQMTENKDKEGAGGEDEEV